MTDARLCDGGFLVSLADGAEEASRFLLLATGVADELPPVAEIGACYGRSVFHCPYCDGWEWRDRRLAVVGTGTAGVGLALSLKNWSSRVLFCSNGSRIDRRHSARLRRNGIEIRHERIERLDHDQGLLSSITFDQGGPALCDALFFTTGQHPQCDLAVRLGCAFNSRGTVTTGTLSNTNVPGVFVAGDASRDATVCGRRRRRRRQGCSRHQPTTAEGRGAADDAQACRSAMRRLARIVSESNRPFAARSGCHRSPTFAMRAGTLSMGNLSILIPRSTSDQVTGVDTVASAAAGPNRLRPASGPRRSGCNRPGPGRSAAWRPDTRR